MLYGDDVGVGVSGGSVGVIVGVTVGVCVIVGVTVGVRVIVGVCVKVGVGVIVGVTVGVGVVGQGEYNVQVEHAANDEIGLLTKNFNQMTKELNKIEKYAPGSDVFIRVLLGDTEALRPLNKKFGCSATMATHLIEVGQSLNINIVGLSFHVGSQTVHPHMWFDSLDVVSNLWNDLKTKGHNLTLLNIGGGFPSRYDQEITDIPTYCNVIKNTIKQKFGNIENIFAEPGRALVANSGIIIAEAILVSNKDINDPDRWLYLNIGRFGGLYSTDGEVFKYRITAPKSDGENTPYIVAGPTLHSADILYEKHRPLLPKNIKSGDKILIHNTGAYTSVYSSRFNGFNPVKVKVLK